MLLAQLIVQCEAGKNIKLVSNRLCPFMFSYSLYSLVFLWGKFGHQDYFLVKQREDKAHFPLDMLVGRHHIERVDLLSTTKKLSSLCL